MSFRHPFRTFALLGILATLGAASAHAQGPSTTSPSTSNLTISATAQSALQIDIATDAGGATVTGATGENSTGVFSVSFGNVNGLGIGSPTSGVSITSRDSSGALYTSPIKLTPYFSGFTSTTATIKVYQDATTSSNSQAAVREGGAPGSVATVPTTALTANTVTSTAASGTDITRYVGLFVSNANGGSSVTGALAPKVIYEVSVAN
jgi:hypothetical protein